MFNGIMILFRTKDNIYFRVPDEAQEEITWGCDCDYCRKQKQIDPNYKPKWNVAVLSSKAPKKGNDFISTVHMPEPFKSMQYLLEKDRVAKIREERENNKNKG